MLYKLALDFKVKVYKIDKHLGNFGKLVMNTSIKKREKVERVRTNKAPAVRTDNITISLFGHHT